MHNLKVFQIIPQFMYGGAEIMVENLSYALKKQGIDVQIISFFNTRNEITERIESKGIKIHYLGKKIGFDYNTIVKLYRLVSQEKPDVIHTHIGGINYAVPAALIAGIKVKVHTFHNIATMETSFLNRCINRLYYKYFGVIPVSISPNIQKTVSQGYGIKKSLIPVVYNGEDLSIFKTKVDYSFKTHIKLLHIGRFAKQKNHVGLIKVFAQLVHVFPNIELDLVGDGSLTAEIRNLVCSLNLEKNVNFLGLRLDINNLMHDADLFVLPSLYEGMPMTLIEAMASGLPIVATKVGGVSDMINDGKDGLLVDVDINHLKAAIEKMIKSQKIREELGTEAHITAQKFSSHSMANEYIKIYQTKF